MSFATLEQLVSNKDNPEDYINNDAYITFFETIYRRYKEFAKINNEYILQNCKFGNVSEFIFPKTDYINNITLSIFLPTIKCKYRKWTKQQLQEKLKEFGYNWYVNKEDLNKELTDEDFDKLVGGKILKNDDGYYREHNNEGIINNLLKNLLTKKEYYESILNQLNQIIKDILNNITLTDIRKLFNYINFPCDNFTNLIIDTDFKVKNEVFNLYNELTKELINTYINIDYGYFDDIINNITLIYDNNNLIEIIFNNNNNIKLNNNNININLNNEFKYEISENNNFIYIYFNDNNYFITSDNLNNK